MDRFGSDRPDLRFGLELRDVSDALQTTRFQAFAGDPRRRRPSQGARRPRLRRLQPRRDRGADRDRQARRRQRAGDAGRPRRRDPLADRQVPVARGTGGADRRRRRRRRRPGPGGRRPARRRRQGALRAARRIGPAAAAGRPERLRLLLGLRVPAAGVERRGEPLGGHPQPLLRLPRRRRPPARQRPRRRPRQAVRPGRQRQRAGRRQRPQPPPRRPGTPLQADGLQAGGVARPLRRAARRARLRGAAPRRDRHGHRPLRSCSWPTSPQSAR